MIQKWKIRRQPLSLEALKLFWTSFWCIIYHIWSGFFYIHKELYFFCMHNSFSGFLNSTRYVFSIYFPSKNFSWRVLLLNIQYFFDDILTFFNFNNNVKIPLNSLYRDSLKCFSQHTHLNISKSISILVELRFWYYGSVDLLLHFTKVECDFWT